MSNYSVVEKTKLKGKHRVDAEYYQPDYLEVEKSLNSIETTTIGEISESVVNFGAYSLCNYIVWQESGVPYLNVENIKDGYIDFDGVKFIDKKVSGILKKSEVKQGQVILTMAGTVGNAAVAHKIPHKLNSNQATAKITLKKDFSPYYLVAFLNSYYGRKQTQREIVSSVQPNIFLWQIKNFRVPVASKEKQEEIEKIYKQGLDNFEDSKLLYCKAERMVLEEIGWAELDFSQPKSWTVNLSQTRAVHRIDAEHFQPMFDKLILHLTKTGKANQIKDLLAEPIRKGITPHYDSNGSIVVVNSQHLGRCYLHFESTDRTTEAFWKTNSGAQIRQNDVMIYATGAYIGRSNAYLEKASALAGVDILIVRPTNECNPLYLAVFLNSLPGLLQSKKFSTGSAQAHIYPETVSRYWIYIPPRAFQEKMAKLVQQSYELRLKAKLLLKEAKQKVEDLIEGR